MPVEQMAVSEEQSLGTALFLFVMGRRVAPQGTVMAGMTIAGRRVQVASFWL